MRLQWPGMGRDDVINLEDLLVAANDDLSGRREALNSRPQGDRYRQPEEFDRAVTCSASSTAVRPERLRIPSSSKTKAGRLGGRIGDFDAASDRVIGGRRQGINPRPLPYEQQSVALGRPGPLRRGRAFQAGGSARMDG
jgi:hypothetical protein